MKINVVFMVAALLAFAQPAFSSEPVVVDRHGVTAIDGDTILIGNTVYQLAGIDAPELGQVCDHDGHLWLCGLAAGHKLSKQLELELFPIRCFIQAREDDLPLASCLVGDQELSIILLKSGAVAAAPNGSPHYKAAEHLARQGSLGIWGSSFIKPWRWRKGDRLPNEDEFQESSHPTARLLWKFLESRFLPLQTENATCMIKGDMTGQGQRFYYTPLDRDYETISIEKEKGERFFCSDDEARQAGWRRKAEAQAGS